MQGSGNESPPLVYSVLTNMRIRLKKCEHAGTSRSAPHGNPAAARVVVAPSTGGESNATFNLDCDEPDGSAGLLQNRAGLLLGGTESSKSSSATIRATRKSARCSPISGATTAISSSPSRATALTNFSEILRLAKGEFVFLLADDDFCFDHAIAVAARRARRSAARIHRSWA